MKAISSQITAKKVSSFGSPMVARVYEADTAVDYRFGFNGKENTDEIYGDGNGVDFGARIYDSRLGRFLSVDPQTMKFPNETPYCFSGNSPVLFIDNQGKYKVIYFAFLPDEKTHLTIEQKKEIIQKAQQTLKDNDIDITVVGIDVTGRIDPSLLNQSDNIVYFGTTEGLEKALPAKDADNNDIIYSIASYHFGIQESFVNILASPENMAANYDDGPNQEAKDRKTADKTGEARDNEAYMAIAGLHEPFHRWLKKHVTPTNQCDNSSGTETGCNEGTTEKENMMECGHASDNHGPNYPMQQGTYRYLLKESAQTLQKMFGKVSEAGWDKNKTRDNLTLKKEAKNVVKGKIN